MEKYVDVDSKQHSLLDIADLYPHFPSIDEVLSTGEKWIDTLDSENRPETPEGMPEEMMILFRQLKAATDILEKSLSNQDTLGLADKRWMRDTKSLDEAFERGRLVVELDVRQDKEGNFWVSHAVGANASFLPPYIHNLSTKEMETSKRFSLGEGLKALQKYKERGHRFILELKTLGDGDEVAREQQVNKLKEILSSTGTEGSIAVASLSPGILMTVNKLMPEVQLMLNGGIIPGFSYTKMGEKVARMLPKDSRWHAVGIPHMGEVVMSASEESVVRPDGYGTQTGYMLTSLPKDLLEVLQKQARQPEKYGKFGGVVSLSAVTIFANALKTFGADQQAKDMVGFYSKILNKLGVNIMVTTWGQGASWIPGLRHLQSMEQLAVFKETLGFDTIVYTKAPEDWAHLVPPEIIDYVRQEQTKKLRRSTM
ncbi:MAG: hypothetical protein AAB947_00290 [Patescibacteria group bacterium]